MLLRLSAVLIGGAAVLALNQMALAADLPARVPVYKSVPVSVFSWTGFYVGANGGYAWGKSDVSTTVGLDGGYFVDTDVPQINAAGPAGIKPNGGTGGIQAGYNWQGGNTVFGVEVDFNALGLKTSRVITVEYLSALGTTFTINQSVKTNWLFTARPRFGWTVNNWLIYATGGLAITGLKYDNSFTDTYGPAFETGSVSKTKTGWVVGGGFEYGFSRNWSAKAEYLYIDFGSVASAGFVTGGGGAAGTLDHSANLRANIVRAGINYRFN